MSDHSTPRIGLKKLMRLRAECQEAINMAFKAGHFDNASAYQRRLTSLDKIILSYEISQHTSEEAKNDL